MPTADEWGYAAGGGKNYDLYVSTGKSAPDGDQNNTTAVSNTNPNSVGICGMGGNAMEICQDGEYLNIEREQVGRFASSTRYALARYKYDASIYYPWFRNNENPRGLTCITGFRLCGSEKF